jgi:hypothetical protein
MRYGDCWEESRLTCVAITRGGVGSLWKFRSVIDADTHPLVQVGDAILSSEDDMMSTFRLPELADLAARLDSPHLATAIRSWTGQVARQDHLHYVQKLWALVQRQASPPPGDPAEIVRLIRQDRTETRSTGVTVRLHPSARSQHNMTEEATKTRPPAREPKIATTGVITFGKNAEGVEYGVENNPKRAGSAANERFARYKAGMTVAEAIEAGVTRADINWDVKQGFIIVA